MRHTQISVAVAIALVVSCGKKNGDKDDPAPAPAPTATGTGTGSESLSTNVTAPVGVISIALNAMGSAMDTDVSQTLVANAGAGLQDAEHLTIDDCTDRAEAKARSTDADEFKDNQNRLRFEHPRAVGTTLYCQMQKDTGGEDSLLGALSGNRLLFCFIGDAVFDGSTQARTVTKASVLACLSAHGASAEEQAEFAANLPETVNTTVTANAPAAFGKAGEWDASINLTLDFGGEPMTLKILGRDSGGVLALAVNNNGQGGASVDGFVVTINRTTGEVRFESKFQRTRIANGSSSTGFNRHTRIYVKGTLDADSVFTAVTDLQGAYSDITLNVGATNSSDPTGPIKMGMAWTAKGSRATGFLSNTYNLSCTGADAAMTCADPNLGASWVQLASAGSCNGSMTGTTCTGTDLDLATDADTAFVMATTNAAFETTEAWFATLAVPTYTSVEMKISQ